jgi:Fibrinogen beta and gamma chains, C-terminal globular domain
VAESYIVNVTTPGQTNVTTVSIFDWIVIMTRNTTQGNWSQPWSSYRDGFTLSKTDLWIGLERMHHLTSFASYRLRLEMYIPNDGSNWRSVEYSTFTISSESTGYAATFQG